MLRDIKLEYHSGVPPPKGRIMMNEQGRTLLIIFFGGYMNSKFMDLAFKYAKIAFDEDEVPVGAVIVKDKRIVLIDDSIVRGTQMRETTEFLYKSGAKEVHVRSACPPLLYGCKYLNFSRSTSEMELIARRAVMFLEGNCEPETLKKYHNPDSQEYANMVEYIRKELHFTSLQFNRLDDLKEACEIDPEKLCTYCWDGKE